LSAWVRVWDLLPVLLAGAVTTLQITAGGFVVAVALGLLAGVLLGARTRAIRAVVRVYVDVFRAVPVLTQLFILYFGLVEIGIRLQPMQAAILGFGLNGGASLAEVFRAGILSVHGGQTEAAQMLGMRRLAVLRIVVLPQAMRVVLPSLANYVIGLLKDSTLASAVAAPEMMFLARKLVDRTFLGPQIFLTVAVLYLAMSLPLGQLARLAEARAGKGRR
jgi:His/Glu/Gln/Arg/opine family amino acid ABC transporter permease subunit